MMLNARSVIFWIDVVILFSSVSAAILPSLSRQTEGTLISAACSCRTAQTSMPRKRSNSPLHDAECKICNILDWRRDFVFFRFSGDTPVTLASYGGHADICGMLVQNGADVNAKTKE
jgi:hypothetical protein